jgi:hypothetical protein
MQHSFFLSNDIDLAPAVTPVFKENLVTQYSQPAGSQYLSSFSGYIMGCRIRYCMGGHILQNAHIPVYSKGHPDDWERCWNRSSRTVCISGPGYGIGGLLQICSYGCAADQFFFVCQQIKKWHR